jgi:2-succinyl-6-hydroxy-2,4-cyclohexadiene-1-carboxylate synthase
MVGQPIGGLVSEADRYPVLLHGFTGSSDAWGERIVDGLAGAGSPPVLVDLPGHGKEAGGPDPKRYTRDATLDLIAAAGDWPTDLVGYSMGARIALHFAAARPGRVRRLVLESGSPGLAEADERKARLAADEALAARIVEEGIEAFVDHWESQPIFETRQALSQQVRAHQREIRVRNDPQSLAAALSALGTGSLPSLWEELPSISVPTLLLVGALDSKFVDIAERMTKVMRDARLVVVPDAGHTVHLERPAMWLEAVTDFLRDPRR